MRLSRRRLLTGLAALAGAGAPVSAAEIEARSVVIAARPIPSFEPRSPEKRRFGELNFRSGLILRGDHERFGGFSGLWRSADGRELVALNDRGYWLTARPDYREGRLFDLKDAAIAPILGASGQPLARSRYYDTEALTIVDGVAYVGVERAHSVLRFDWGRDGVRARAKPVPVPPEVAKLPRNQGLEAIGVIPPGHPLAGRVVAISERSGKEDEPTRGFILGLKNGLFEVVRHDGFDITDMAFLPGGDLVLLERWYRPLRGVGLRIRRITGADLKPGARLDGPYLLGADLGQEIDNMEGLSVHLENGRTVLTLISDDNFSFLQRTILLEFELAG